MFPYSTARNIGWWFFYRVAAFAVLVVGLWLVGAFFVSLRMEGLPSRKAIANEGALSAYADIITSQSVVGMLAYTLITVVAVAWLFIEFINRQNEDRKLVFVVRSISAAITTVVVGASYLMVRNDPAATAVLYLWLSLAITFNAVMAIGRWLRKLRDYNTGWDPARVPDAQKTVIRNTTVTTGVVFGAVASVAIGYPWWVAIVIVGTPLAIYVGAKRLRLRKPPPAAKEDQLLETFVS